MGGGQDLGSTEHLNEWELSWDLDSHEGEESDSSENLAVLGSNSGVSSECDPEVQRSKSSQLTSATPSFEKESLRELRRRIIQHGEALATRDDIRQTRGKLNRYTPGSSILNAQGMNGREIVIPDVATLLIVGFKGAGKSTLINNIIRALHDKPTGFFRAPVSGNPGVNGTYFIGEYMICGDSGRPRVSLFDTRGLSEDDTNEDMALLEGWMKHGVRHGQMDLRASDSKYTKELLVTRGRHGVHHLSKKKKVNCVIFVVDAVSVLKMKESGDASKQETMMLLYRNPYLTFKDDCPVVVMTNGDKLSHDERISARIYLGEFLGVPPVEQIFDISGTMINSDNGIEATPVILDMLSSALDCADRNFPCKRSRRTILSEGFNLMMKSEPEDNDKKVALIGIFLCTYILFLLFLHFFFSTSKGKLWIRR